MRDVSFAGERIWIVGASSGIGRALAVRLSAAGATLVLSARSEEKLAALNAELGMRHQVLACDASLPESLSAALAALTQHSPRLDRVIHLAAAYEPMPLDRMDMGKVAEIVQANLLGTFALIHCVLPLFQSQGRGQIALCGSVAGYMGLPNGQPYSATKAAIINLAESLRAECPPGIDVKLISPGFVRTGLTAKNNFAMPMLLEPEEAAAAIARGLNGRAFEIHFPKTFTLFLKLLRLLPYGLLNPLLRRLKPQ